MDIPKNCKCGKEPQINVKKRSITTYQIECTSCGTSTTYDTKEETITKWNAAMVAACDSYSKLK